MKNPYFFIIGLAFTIPQASYAGTALPKWEIGFGPGVISYPDYPGSKEQNTLILSIPYFVYHGKDFSINNNELVKSFFKKTILN